MAKYFNKTRVSKSIPRRLINEGKLHLLPVYFLAKLSYLGREAIENSGSYHFADHIYVGIPKGKYFVGKIVDRIFLLLPSARSFRNRYISSREELLRNLPKYLHEKQIDLLSVPSGIPRDFMDIADSYNSALLKKIRFHCLDLDTKVLNEVKILLKKNKHTNFKLYKGDALNIVDYKVKPHMIVSTGLGEFLDEKTLLTFYSNCYTTLRDKGVFITAMTKKHTVSEYLMKNIAELLAYYRDEKDAKRIFGKTKFKKLKIYTDKVGYQIIIVAEK